MPHITKISGVPGAGKTTLLLNEIADLRNEGVDIAEIGFCSFTRAAARTAIERACDAFDVSPDWMRMSSWFRTIHAIAYRQLDDGDAKKRLLTWEAKDRNTWFPENVEEANCGMKPVTPEDYATDGLQSDANDNYWGPVLRMWDSCRLRLAAPSAQLARQFGFGKIRGKVLDYCDYGDSQIVDMIARFERAKRDTRRLDFSDFVAKLAGVAFSPDGNHNLSAPATIDLPDCVVWFFDEYQDMNPLLDRVVDRVIEDSPARKVYLAGDGFQSIYGFSGSEPRLFFDRYADNTINLHKSWRCPQAILGVGERIIKRHPDYIDRGVTSENQGDGTEAVECSRIGDVIEYLRGANLASGPRGEASAMFLARTNQDVMDVRKTLNDCGVPWSSTKDPDQGYIHQASMNICRLMMRLRDGEAIKSSDWRKLVAKIPHKLAGDEMLVRGCKSKMRACEIMLPGDMSGTDPECIQLQDTLRYGATNDFVLTMQSESWCELFPKSALYAHAVEKFGESVADRPGLRVGTIHSVKGEEADLVVLLDRVSDYCFNESGLSAEACVSYVGTTRARKQLIVLRQSIKSQNVVEFGEGDWAVRLPSLGVPDLPKLGAVVAV